MLIHVLSGNPGSIDDDQTVPVLGLRAAGVEAATLSTSLFATGAGGQVNIQVVTDAAIIAGEGPSTRGNLPTMARVTLYDPVTNDFSPAQVISIWNPDAQDLSAYSPQFVGATPFLYNGATFDSSRNNSASNITETVQPQAALSAAPGEWAVNSEPAVSVQASATRAAGAAGVRHVCRSLHFSLAAVVAQTIISARVRDGATGAGTVLWSQQVIVPAGENVHIELSGLNIVGSAATAMTFEWSAAPVATNFQTAGGSGYSTI